MTRETLEHLVARYLGDGDEEAAEEVVRRTRPKLLAVARRIGSPQDAEDAVHTAYLSLLHKRGGALDAPALPSGWSRPSCASPTATRRASSAG